MINSLSKISIKIELSIAIKIKSLFPLEMVSLKLPANLLNNKRMEQLFSQTLIMEIKSIQRISNLIKNGLDSQIKSFLQNNGKLLRLFSKIDLLIINCLHLPILSLITYTDFIMYYVIVQLDMMMIPFLDENFVKILFEFIIKIKKSILSITSIFYIKTFV
jgi:hypothetical protein